MRLAQIANFIGPTSGGMKTAVEALGAGYRAHGHRTLLVVPDAEDGWDEVDGGLVRRLRAPRVGGGYRLIVEPWRITEALEAFEPTSVELSDKWSLLPVTRWARRNDVQTVLFSHERLDAMLSLRTGLTRGLDTGVAALNRVLVRAVDTIVVTSRFAQHEFARSAAAAGTPLVTVPLGVDLATFHPLPRPANAELRLTHVGRLSREKSPHLAVETAVALHRRGIRLVMDVYGDGPHRDELELIAGDAPIVFHGHVSDRQALAAAIGRADVALSVCPGETFGLAVLEALACGTPVVTADRGGARELVDAASGGWAGPTAESLADAVLEVAARPLHVRRAAARARAELFTWDRSIVAMLDVHSGRDRFDGYQAELA